MVRYDTLNLLAPSWPINEKFDAIFCRNVMIYFDKPTQARILERFVPCSPGGLLFAGHSENFTYISQDFRLRGQTVYECGAGPRPAQAAKMQKIRVLCVDDSALVRGLMTEIINSQPDMEVVATAPDPLVARELIKRHNPDVLTLDVEMPRMDGLDFLEKLMRLRPMPVVMVSSLTERGGEITLRALELGAIDFVTKPKLGIRDGLLEYTEIIADKIRAASRAKLRAPAPHAPAAAPAPALRRPLSSSEKLVIVGASTGGTEAIREVLQPLPPDSPAILITQHMPAGFTRSFAQRLDALCAVTVREAVHGERVLPGHVYLAPGGDTHMRLAAAAPTTSSNWTPANPSTATARRWTCCSIRPRWRRARTPSASS